MKFSDINKDPAESRDAYVWDDEMMKLAKEVGDIIREREKEEYEHRITGRD